MKETDLLRQVLIYGSTLGMRLFRNQVGRYRLALPDCVRCQRIGRVVTSGLCVGSADIIGWTPKRMSAADVGHIYLVFTALETKVGKNTTTTEQGAFLSAVHSSGGIAAVVRRLSDVDAAVRGL